MSFGINVISRCNRSVGNIKVFENFLADLKNYGKKISSPPGQNLDIANSTVGAAAMTFKHKTANIYGSIDNKQLT